MARMVQRGATAAQWADSSYTFTTGTHVLLAREIGIETDTGKVKIGDGVTAWTALPYQPASADITAAIATAENRANHTGTQAAGTITGLATVATSGAYGDLSGKPTIPAAYTDAQAAAAAPVQSVAGRTGTVSLTRTDVGLGNVDNTADASKPVSTAQASADGTVQAYAVQRANHTGTQAAATITGLATVATSGAYTDLTGRPAIQATTTDPTVSSDSTGGYAVGSQWVNTTKKVLYTCVSAAAGAAVWQRSGADVQVFTASGTWTKPAWVSQVTVAGLGAGGPSGSGRRTASGTAGSGGGGGGGGGWMFAAFDAAQLTATVSITVGTSPAGGAAVTVDSTNGNAGAGSGGASQFGSYLRAQGGSAGGGGGTANTSAAGGGNGTAGGSSGGIGTTSSAGGSGGTGPQGAPGGGAGGGLPATPTFQVGGNGGLAQQNNFASGGLGGTTDGAAGVAGTASANLNLATAGSGAGGGASSVTTAGGNGGVGGTYGAGAGGGGCSLNGNASGAGAAGGPGIVVVISR